MRAPRTRAEQMTPTPLAPSHRPQLAHCAQQQVLRPWHHGLAHKSELARAPAAPAPLAVACATGASSVPMVHYAKEHWAQWASWGRWEGASGVGVICSALVLGTLIFGACAIGAVRV